LAAQPGEVVEFCLGGFADFRHLDSIEHVFDYMVLKSRNQPISPLFL
jgi:hypothetical protein